MRIMKLCLIVVAMAFLLAMAPIKEAQAASAMTRDKALEVLKQLAPDIKIVSFEQAPLGLWEVGFLSGGQISILYLDPEGKYILMGSLIEIATKTNLTKEKFEELTKIDTSQIPLEDAVIVGDAKAKKRVIVFSDPDCPYCDRLHKELKQVVKERKDIAFFVKLFPLVKIHPDSYKKSKSIVCEKDKVKALKLLDDAFAKKAIPDNSCDTKALDENIALARKLGIDGTPTIILPDGKRAGGAMDAESLIKQIDGK